MTTNIAATFNHRDIEEAPALPIDLYAVISDSVESIHTFTELLNSDNHAATDEVVHDQLLKQINSSSSDILCVLENFINTNDITPLVDEEAVEIVQLMEAYQKGEKLGGAMLLELESIDDPEEIELTLLKFSKQLAIFATNNSQLNNHGILFNFLSKVIAQNEVETA
ncbi:MAG: hypothetical protein QM500_16390 [Methylococcales bacterium]